MTNELWSYHDEAREVSERLLATEAEDEREDEARGRMTGIRWAKHTARMRDLSEIAEVDFDGTLWLRSENTLNDLLMDEGLLPRRDYEGPIGHEVTPYLRGIVEGAVEVLTAVNDLALASGLPSV